MARDIIIFPAHKRYNGLIESVCAQRRFRPTSQLSNIPSLPCVIQSVDNVQQGCHIFMPHVTQTVTRAVTGRDVTHVNLTFFSRAGGLNSQIIKKHYISWLRVNFSHFRGATLVLR